MLVLSRKIDQTIMIGDDVAVTLLSIQGNQVQLGIVAPCCIQIHRREIYLRNMAKRADRDDGRSIEG
jgi:carbon storage regulator